MSPGAPASAGAAPHTAASERGDAQLESWAQQKHLSAAETAQRQLLAKRIRAPMPGGQADQTGARICAKAGLQPSCDTIFVAGDLDASDCPDVTKLPEDLCIAGNLSLVNCEALTRLPGGLRVGGELNLSRCAALIQLHPELYVGGELNLCGCTSLTQLPDGLRIESNLILAGCESLTHLPAGLWVGGYLNVTQCTALEQLPASLTVQGHLYASGCKRMSQLPAKLSVGGNLNLAGCKDLAELPEELQVRGHLDLSACIRLTRLPRALDVGGGLQLFGCTALAQLPAGLQVRGFCKLLGCTSLAQLPADMRVDDDLVLSECTQLTQLAQGLRVGGSLDLSGCNQLTQLPEDLVVGGSLNGSGCTQLTRLPDGVRVGRSYSFSMCPRLAQLPSSFDVRGNLNLTGCTALSQLPERLRVGGSLYLLGCTALTHLPEQLNVGRQLILSRCEALSHLPAVVEIGGDLNLSDCVGLTSLPTWIVHLGFRSDGNRRVVNLVRSGLPAHTIRHLQTLHPQGMQLILEMGPPLQGLRPFATLAEAVQFWAEQNTSYGALDLSRWNLDGDEQTTLRQYLTRLRSTADYTNVVVRPHLVLRVSELLNTMDQDSHARAQALDCMSHALSSCSDRIIWVMNQLELATRLHTAEQGALSSAATRKLVLGLMQLDVVHAHARAKVKRLQFVDEVEVFLAYEVGLRDVLQLPVSTQTMMFAQCAPITAQDLTHAQRDAERAVADETQVRHYLQTSFIWQRHLRAVEARAWSWEALTPGMIAETLRLSRMRCPLTLEPYAALSQPVVWRYNGTYVVYEAAQLLTHWVAHGFEPTTRQPMALGTLIRPTPPQTFAARELIATPILRKEHN